MNEKTKEELNKTEENIIQLNKFIEETFAFIAIIYIAVSLGIGLFLLIYNFILVPLNQAFSPYTTSEYTLSVQQINQLNLSQSEKIAYLSIVNNTYQQIMQLNQSFTPIPTNQLIEDELILMVPPIILLGLIYYVNKKENHDE